MIQRALGTNLPRKHLGPFRPHLRPIAHKRNIVRVVPRRAHIALDATEEEVLEAQHPPGLPQVVAVLLFLGHLLGVVEGVIVPLEDVEAQLSAVVDLLLADIEQCEHLIIPVKTGQQTLYILTAFPAREAAHEAALEVDEAVLGDKGAAAVNEAVLDVLAAVAKVDGTDVVDFLGVVYGLLDLKRLAVFGVFLVVDVLPGLLGEYLAEKVELGTKKVYLAVDITVTLFLLLLQIVHNVCHVKETGKIVLLKNIPFKPFNIVFTGICVIQNVFITFHIHNYITYSYDIFII